MREIISWIQSVDNHVLWFFQSIHTPFFNKFFWYITEGWIFLPLWIWALYLIYKEYPTRQYMRIFIMIILCVLISDQMSNLFKYQVKRLRPTHHPVYQQHIELVNQYKGGKYGFYSAHASNSATVSVLFILLVSSRKKYWILVYPFLSGMSRVYLAVHYLSDILVGWAMGGLIALFVYWLIHSYTRLNSQ